MIAKVKRHSLFLVALYLGYSGYGSTQPDEEASAIPTLPEPLPQLYEENMPLRDADQLSKKVPDPFRIAQRFLRTDAELEDPGLIQEETGEDEESPVLELQSTMRLMDGPVAFINQRTFRIGQELFEIPGGGTPVLKSVRGPVIEIEYLDKVYQLDLHANPRLRLGKTSAKLMAADQASLGEGESGGSSVESGGGS